MTAAYDPFTPFAERMQAENLPEIFIRTFRYYYEQLAEGHTGLIPEAEIEPIDNLPDAETFPDALAEIGKAALGQTVLIKLNGGLGTSMGLTKAKSLLTVKDGLTFLDIIARQALHASVPLLLMDSFNTREDSLAALRAYPDLWGDLPLDFLQHKAPKIVQSDLSPALWPRNPALEWNPPGHGDIYTALLTSGMLEKLLEAGYRYAFVSNADNLGAVLDAKILGYFVEQQLPFMSETADRTPADRKGGHLAIRRSDGQIILRETAQTPPEDTEALQDINRHRYFNTNNIWWNLQALQEVITARDGILGLPLIRNSKTVDPRDPTSTPVYQIETAMGSAIAVFKGSGAIRAPRSRFAPVKTTDDLLAVRSDAYVLSDDFRVVPNPARTMPQLVVSLDSRFYKLIDDMEARFPYGAPSLLECERLTVEGDVLFEKGVVCKGVVELDNRSEEQMVVGAEDQRLITKD
jgi:UTP--glucose-1-phosphate uridylyltransferase